MYERKTPINSQGQTCQTKPCLTFKTARTHVPNSLSQHLTQFHRPAEKPEKKKKNEKELHTVCGRNEKDPPLYSHNTTLKTRKANIFQTPLVANIILCDNRL